MPAVSKRTYEAVAKAIKENTYSNAATDTVDIDRDELVTALADYFEFEQDNERFDRNRFVKACGWDG